MPGGLHAGGQACPQQDLPSLGPSASSRLFSSGQAPLAGRLRVHCEGMSCVIQPNMGQGGWAPEHNRFATQRTKTGESFVNQTPLWSKMN